LFDGLIGGFCPPFSFKLFEEGAVMKFQTSFRNNHNALFLSKAISSYFNRGTSLASTVQTVLNTLRDLTGVKNLKDLNEKAIQSYVSHIQERVANMELSRKTAEGYISGLNRVLEYTNEVLGKNFQTFSPSELGLSRGSFVYVDRAVSLETHQKFLSFLSEKQDIRAQALSHSVNLQREFGLRLRESLAIKSTTIERALETGVLHLSKEDGTKNSREREIHIRTEEQRETLQKTLDFMKENNLFSLAPTEHLREQYRFAYEVKKEFESGTGEKFTFHGERHAFAQAWIEAGVDRLTVSSWLGHGREEITKVYAK
jgi:site-specific recombinase XerD